MPESKQQHEASLTTHTAANYQTHANFVYSDANTSPVLELLNAQPGECIIDLGCGTGQVTVRIKALVGSAGEVWGVDSSENMLDEARESVGTEGITFVQADIQAIEKHLDLSLKGKFDAVFSSATFHWCKANPGGVVESVKWLLKPGGRMVWEMGGFGNTVGVRAAIHQALRKRGVDPVPLDPWYFPTVGQYTALLEKHGMTPGHIALVPRPTPLSTDVRGWLATFARLSFLAAFAEEDADDILNEVQEVCRPDAYWNDERPGMGSEGGAGKEGWEIMYVRLRGTARWEGSK